LEPIPQLLKIHQSAMFHLGLTAGNQMHETLSRHYQTSMETPLSELTLVVSTGLGVSHKASSDATLVVERLNHKISNNGHFVFLKQLASFSPEDSFWTRSSRSIGSIECNFKDISFQVNNESGVVYVTNLHTLVPHGDNQKIRAALDGSDELVTSKYCYADLLATLSLDPEVIDIRVRGSFRTLNQRGKSIVQSDTITSLSYPYHVAGLTGEGQIIGVGDTGVDELSCFFANSDFSLVARSSYRNPKYDLSKRVVIQYIDYANSADVSNGHGTHVCGTVAGSVSTTDNYNGHGVGAQIAFFDMSINGDSIFYPTPLSKNVFAAAYTAGARVHSNSWGSNMNLYDDSCIDIDSYHLEKEDFLAIFAAGNDVRIEFNNHD
jgi:hypothetical protein